mgnify:CR=1 FL=1
MAIVTVGIDLAKNVFAVHGVDEFGKPALVRPEVPRAKLVELIANVPPCLIGMEACASAHYWARELGRMGHQVRLIPPQFVKPYVKTNKNDAADAEAICEAVSRPNMRFVPIKTVERFGVDEPKVIREQLDKRGVNVPLVGDFHFNGHRLLTQHPACAEALAKLRPESDLIVEELLHEPEVAQPTHVSFDERGRMWVAQYRQYPYPAGLKMISRDKYYRSKYDRVPPR